MLQMPVVDALTVQAFLPNVAMTVQTALRPVFMIGGKRSISCKPCYVDTADGFCAPIDGLNLGTIQSLSEKSLPPNSSLLLRPPAMHLKTEFACMRP